MIIRIDVGLVGSLSWFCPASTSSAMCLSLIPSASGLTTDDEARILGGQGRGEGLCSCTVRLLCRWWKRRGRKEDKRRGIPSDEILKA